MRRILQPVTANKVLKIIISSGNHEDKLIWEMERNGCFSMRSAYRVFRSLRTTRVVGESCTTSREKQLWNGIWKLKIPHKIKLFAQRAYIDGLPTKSYLKRRRAFEEESCQLCSSGIENNLHALYQCPLLRAMW